MSTPALLRIRDAALRLFAERGGGEISVSELAAAAGVARGTIYNNVAHPEALFAEVAGGLAQEMVARVEESMRGIDDPALRLATGVRLFVRRTHEEPDWGRFVVRFAGSDDLLRAMMDEPPAHDISKAIASGRFTLDMTRHRAFVSLLGGAAIAAMRATLEGAQTWRDAGSDAAELLLRAAGVPPAEARRIAHAALPALALPDRAGNAAPRKDRR